MDEMDRSIIDMMVDNGRISFRKIAKKFDKSPDTIIHRYEHLLETGDIRGSTVVLAPNKFGYEGMAAFHIDVSKSSDLKTDSTSILKTLIKMPNIIVATKTVGEHDLLAIGVIHGVDHLMSLGKEITDIPGVENIQTSLWAGGEKVCPRYFII
jgi:Lrp/AsnC family transcriptional regulator, regulator for asnA, asnC and gidA